MMSSLHICRMVVTGKVQICTNTGEERHSGGYSPGYDAGRGIWRL